MTRQSILDEVKAERERQIQLWGKDHDNSHTINDWVSIIAMYAGKAIAFKLTSEDRRYLMIQVAAIAVAAVEACDGGSSLFTWKDQVGG